LKQLKRARLSPDFSREYECNYSWGSNGVFGQQFIDRAIELGNKYPVTINKQAQHSLGIDTGFGSSACAFCILEHSDNIIKVVYADRFQRSSFNDMIQKLWELQTMVGPQGLDNVYIDGSNAAFVEAAKQELGEDSNWTRVHEKINHCRREGFNVSNYMRVVPVSFGQEGPAMLSRAKSIIENEDSLIAINKKWESLIVALRGAVAQNGKLDKSQSPENDILDSFILACKFFSLEK
jgi:hypothetical protein